MEKFEYRGIAETIRKQLGDSAFMMMGAKNISKGHTKTGNEYLSFKIGKNSMKVNFIKISLNGLDLYDIEFGWSCGSNYTVRAESEDVFVGDMHSIIEDNTGLYLRLF